MPEKPDHVIQFEGVSLRYGKVAALHEISFSIMRGETIAIVGPSGSGKTSILKVISGALTPIGQVKIKGRLGIVYQDAKLLPWKSVAENIFLGADKQDAALAQTGNWLEMAGLIEKTTAFPYELSGGQRQRVAVIRALAHNPNILLLDEPFSALDFLAKNKLRALVKEISERNKLTTLTITHDLEEAVKLSERILVINGGRLVADVNLANRAGRDIANVVSEIESYFVEP